jgi:hypothetical protein
MLTKIYEGKREYGNSYWQGLIYLTAGRLKNTWYPVTIQHSNELDAIYDLESFKESCKNDYQDTKTL